LVTHEVNGCSEHCEDQAGDTTIDLLRNFEPGIARVSARSGLSRGTQTTSTE
jgi:hypothetical protein